MHNQRGKATKYGWIALLGLCLVPCLTPYSCGIQPRVVFAKIPVGSKLSELNDHLGTFYDQSTVEEWIPSRTAGSSEKPTKTKLGMLYVRHLGEYDAWTATKAERDSFTGEISFYRHSNMIPDDLAPSFWIGLVYVKGVLKSKDWGIMPG